nr:hypothetical protein B0A51_04332 [Rachicladosporium sp. CCFEE 5018]
MSLKFNLTTVSVDTEHEESLALRGARVVGDGLFQTLSTSKDKSGRRWRREHLTAPHSTSLDNPIANGDDFPQQAKIVTPIQHVGMYRQQLTMFALDIELPLGTYQRTELLNVYSQWFQPRGKAMSSAIDCALLLYFGRAKHVRVLLPEVSRLHGIALGRLRNEIEAPNALHDDGVLGAIAALAMTANFSELASDNEYWTHHAAVEQIIRARGPGCMSSTFPRQVISNMSMEALVRSHTDKRPLLLNGPAWIEALRPYCTSPSLRLGLAGLQATKLVPALDRLDEEGVNLGASALALVDSVQQTKLAIRREVPNLFDLTLPGPYTTPNLVYTHSVVASTVQCEHDDTVWPFAPPLNFKNRLSGVCFVYYQAFMYYADEVLLDTLSKLDSHGIALPIGDDLVSVSEITARLTAHAEALCRATPYLHSADNVGDTDVFAHGSLVHALRWFERSGVMKQSAWCTRARDRLHTSQLAPAVYDEDSMARRVFGAWPMLM